MTLDQAETIAKITHSIRAGLAVLADCETDDFARLAIEAAEVAGDKSPEAVIATLQSMDEGVAAVIDNIVALRDWGDVVSLCND